MSSQGISPRPISKAGQSTWAKRSLKKKSSTFINICKLFLLTAKQVETTLFSNELL